MSDHLPECDRNLGSLVCICRQLRSCEQRVREDDKNTFLRAAYDTGREDGLSAARDAVAALLSEPAYVAGGLAALAAIDALKGEQA